VFEGFFVGGLPGWSVGLPGGSVGLLGGLVGGMLVGAPIVGGTGVFTGESGDRSGVFVGRIKMDEGVVGETVLLGVAVSGGLTGSSTMSAI
jgi:hypothetical protein